MIDFGTVRPGTTLYIPFNTFDSNDPSASVTITGLATTDIEIYKDGSVTQRASDSGYALLDTDGIDFDGVTGIHGLSIDLADNTTAGFYAAGSQYWVVVSSITVDAATINFVLATFRVGYPDAVLNTTIATLTNQTSFTLTSGPAEDDALNGCAVCIHDVASAVQLGFAVISDYTGATKTVTLPAGVSFTAAATDNIAIYPPANTRWFGQTAQAGDGTNLTEAGGTGDHLTAINLPNQTMDITGNITGNLSGSVGSVAAGGITAASIATDAIDADALATDAIAEINATVDTALSDYDAPTRAELTTDINSVLTRLGIPAAVDIATDIANVGTDAAAAATPAEVNTEAVDVLATDTYAESGAVVAATATLAAAITWMKTLVRNKITQTSTTSTLRNDADSANIATSTVSDDGTTATRGEWT